MSDVDPPPLSPDAAPPEPDPSVSPPPDSRPTISPRPATNQVAGLSPNVPPEGPFPPPTNRPVEWTRLVPEFRLLEAPRIALSPVIVVLALAGLLATTGGEWAIQQTLGGTNAVPVPWQDSPTDVRSSGGGVGVALGPALESLVTPLRAAYAGAANLLSLASTETALRGGLRLLWGLAVWGFFGVAICRCAAVRFATGATGSPTAAVRLAGAKWIGSLGGPLLPAVGLGVLALGLILFGWAGDLPAVGPWVVAVLWGAALLAGLAAVVLLILAAVGWPLMLAALAVQGSDAFDAFSRAFSYILGRPLRVLVHVTAGAAIAAVAVVVVQLAATAAIELAVGFAGVGMGEEDLAALRDGSAGAASDVAKLWAALWRALPAAYAAGLFWTLATISYFLLRYADDAVETDELWQPGRDEPTDDDEVPRIGVAASDLPVIERPHRPTV